MNLSINLWHLNFSLLLLIDFLEVGLRISFNPYLDLDKLTLLCIGLSQYRYTLLGSRVFLVWKTKNNNDEDNRILIRAPLLGSVVLLNSSEQSPFCSSLCPFLSHQVEACLPIL